MAKFLSIVISFLILFSTSGCRLQTEGNTLHGFTMRMNKISETYNLTDTGYIYDEKESTLTKFYDFNSNEIMLQFQINENNKLTCLNIVFGNISENNTNEICFIKNSLISFINEKTLASNLLGKIKFDTVIFESFHETKKEKIDDTEIIIDTTDLGTVITVVKDNP